MLHLGEELTDKDIELFLNDCFMEEVNDKEIKNDNDKGNNGYNKSNNKEETNGYEVKGEINDILYCGSDISKKEIGDFIKDYIEEEDK